MSEALPARIGQILMLMTRDFQRRLDADLQSRGITGIGQRHRDVFLHLSKYGASRSVDLALAVGIRPQSMMVIIQELEELGMIIRQPDPTDSRAKLIRFSAKGRDFIQQLTRSTKTVWRQYERMVGREELRQTIQGLQDLLTLDEGRA